MNHSDSEIAIGDSCHFATCALPTPGAQLHTRSTAVVSRSSGSHNGADHCPTLASSRSTGIGEIVVKLLGYTELVMR